MRAPISDSIRFHLHLMILCAGFVPAPNASAANYVLKSKNQYVAQADARFCGPAVLQMILNADSVKVANDTQTKVYEKMQAANDPNGNFGADVKGMQQALEFYDPPSGGRTYVGYEMANYDAALRTLAYNVAHYNVPAGVLIDEGAHWINVYGVATTVEPALAGPNKDFKVRGFYTRDPKTGFWKTLSRADQQRSVQGLGIEAFIGIEEDADLFGYCFTPISQKYTKNGKPNPSYTGKYAFVADPDEHTSTASARINVTGTPLADATAALNAARSNIANDNDGAGNADLATIASFQNGDFFPTGQTTLTLPNGQIDWLVPYYQTVDLTNPTGAVLINQSNGALDAAFWDSDFAALPLEDLILGLEINYGMEADNIVPEPAFAGIAVGLAMLMGRRRVVWPAPRQDA